MNCSQEFAIPVEFTAITDMAIIKLRDGISPTSLERFFSGGEFAMFIPLKFSENRGRLFASDAIEDPKIQYHRLSSPGKSLSSQTTSKIELGNAIIVSRHFTRSDAGKLDSIKFEDIR